MARIIIFAGAGASKAVNGERFPTTVQFFERLPEEITLDPLFRLVVDYLRRTDSEKLVDIEEVLWELETLRSFATDYRAHSSLAGFALQSDRLVRMFFPKQNQNLGVLDAILHQVSEGISALVGKINAAVYDFYSYEPEDIELENNWLYLLDRVEKVKFDYSIFTTNYDVVIEAAAAARKGLSLDEFAGLSGRVTKKLDLERWKSQKSRRPILTKLHGSINWKFSGEDIKVGDNVYTGDHKKQAIIYPGFKGTSESPFFAPLHAYLGDRFEVADAVFFIGFAFRDEYVNEMIGDRIRPGTSIFVINPADDVKFPVRRLSAKIIKSGFGRESVDQCFIELSKRNIVKMV